MGSLLYLGFCSLGVSRHFSESIINVIIMHGLNVLS